MVSRIAGAFVRAVVVVALILAPSLMLPSVGNAGNGQILALMAIFAFALTMFEYSAEYPSLVEFRYAPPFNRLRFVSLAWTVVMLTLMARGAMVPTTFTMLIEAIGAVIGNALDFPYSPVRLLVLMLPADTTAFHVYTVRNAAGVAYLMSLVTLAIFMITLRLTGWPHSARGFNVWVNLPTFDPTAGGDVVERLMRDSRFNIALGFLLPFVVPAMVRTTTSIFGSVSLENTHVMIWTVTAWAFLPASLFMRGIAMGKVAEMICQERRRINAVAERDGALQVA